MSQSHQAARRTDELIVIVMTDSIYLQPDR